MKKIFCLALGLGLLPILSTTGHANDRYRERPPVIVSPNLTAPWIRQLGGTPGIRPDRARPAPRQMAQPLQQVRPARSAKPRTVSRQPVPPAVYRSAGKPRRNAIRQSDVQPVAVRPNRVIRSQLDPQFLPQTVAYQTKHAAGTIIIDTDNRFLYLVTGGGEARRYGVGVGKPGFEWAGTHSVTRKAEWPRWVPPKEMIAREAAKGHYLPASMEGGPANPLGARALYLGSTLYRIHGTNAPWTIGNAVSSGCIRMRNEDVVDLYGRVDVGTKVIVM